MAAPTPYQRAYDFVTYQSSNPTLPLPANRLHIELAAIAVTTSETIANLGLIQQADGALKNGVVTLDSLSAAVIARIDQGSNPEAPAPTLWGSIDGALENQTDLADALAALTATVSGKAAVDHTHSEATTSAAGLMSAADKVKIDGLTAVGTAAGVSFTPAGNISATDVQAALVEVDNEKVPTSRTLTAGVGLIGGGAFTSNLSVSVNFGGTGSSDFVSRADHTHTGLLPTVGTEGQVLTVVSGAPAYADAVRGEGGVVSVENTESPTSGDPPDAIALVLNPATGNGGGPVSAFHIVEDLTGDFDFQLETAGQRVGHTVKVLMLGDPGSFACTGVLFGGGATDPVLAQYQMLTAQFDGVEWIAQSITSLAPGGLSGFLRTVEGVAASMTLNVAQCMLSKYLGAARYNMLATRPATNGDTVTLTVADDAPEGSVWYGQRGEAHTGPIEIEVESSDGTINGIVGGAEGSTILVSALPRAKFMVEVTRNTGSNAIVTVTGDIVADTAMPGLLRVGSVAMTPLTGVSGALTVAAHGGRVSHLSGNVTVPIDNEFQATLVAVGGTRTVGAGGTPLSLDDGDAVTVWVNGGVVRASPVAATSILPQS